MANGLNDLVPDSTASSFPDASAATGSADVLTWESGGEHINGLDLVPVDGGDVAQVRYAGHSGGEDRADVWVGVSDPCGASAAERGKHAQVQAAVPRAQGADDQLLLGIELREVV